MNIRTSFLIVVLLILLPIVSNAQFGALKRALDKQIDHKIDSSIEQNAQDEKDKKAKEENEQNQTGEASSGKKSAGGKGTGLFGGKIDVKYNDEYDFTGRIFMKMEGYDKKDVIKSDYFTYFNSGKPNAGIEMQTVDPKDNKTVITTTYIFDMENRAFMVLVTNVDPKMGSISAIPSDSAMAANAKEREANMKKPVITKTGNSRMIAGYRCDEYKVLNEEENTYSLIWMTKDINIKADKRNWGRTGMPTYYNYPEFDGSFMLAIQAFDKNDKPKLKLETIEISENYKHSVSTVGYTFTKMNFFQGGNSGKK